jgi:hypothetical protein
MRPWACYIAWLHGQHLTRGGVLVVRVRVRVRVQETLAERKAARRAERDALGRGEVPDSLKNWRVR